MALLVGVGNGMDIPEAAKLLARVREQQGRLVEDVALTAKIGPSALRNYEAGLRAPSLDVLGRWAAALGRRVVFEVREAGDDVEVDPELRQLLRRAQPGHIRAAMAALRALIGDEVVSLPDGGRSLLPR